MIVCSRYLKQQKLTIPTLALFEEEMKEPLDLLAGIFFFSLWCFVVNFPSSEASREWKICEKR